MRFEIDPRSPSVPSEQLADQVRAAVAAGRLAAGARLPSVRGLAAEALVNPNTVSRAYRELEREGTVVARAGRGVFVAARARARCVSWRDALLRERLRRALRGAVAAGLGRAAVRRLVEETLGASEAEWEQAS